MESCIFCKIVKKEMPAAIIFEDEEIIAFKDVNPIAPVHILIIPKKHVPTINSLGPQDGDLAWKILLAAKKIVKERGIFESGYRLVFNVGKDAGQTVEHIHLHLLGGKELPWK
ncbi:MAG: histidine triad nucleotide-binding protein [Candidatus Wildermuthbacteria bacterium]|nr:histidine triad nucleotide-binding protein [Candidatus Wildermuthbacteria bacterium]